MELPRFRHRQPTLTFSGRSWELLWLVRLGWRDTISVRAPPSEHVGHQLTSCAGSKPTSSTSESNVSVAKDSMPWHQEAGNTAREDFKVSITGGCAIISCICSSKHPAHAIAEGVIANERKLTIF